MRFFMIVMVLGCVSQAAAQDVRQQVQRQRDHNTVVRFQQAQVRAQQEKEAEYLRDLQNTPDANEATMQVGKTHFAVYSPAYNKAIKIKYPKTRAKALAKAREDALALVKVKQPDLTTEQVDKVLASYRKQLEKDRVLGTRKKD